MFELQQNAFLSAFKNLECCPLLKNPISVLLKFAMQEEAHFVMLTFLTLF